METGILRLDPGEFGFPGRVPQREAQRIVAAQELGNKIGFQREALARGLDVESARISLTPGPGGQISGRTEVQFAQPNGLGSQIRDSLRVETSPETIAERKLRLQQPEGEVTKLREFILSANPSNPGRASGTQIGESVTGPLRMVTLLREFLRSVTPLILPGQLVDVFA